jgi:aryl-alcohol dehydrogenase-like predicted oxidoreductase
MPHQLDAYRLLGRSGLRVSPLALGTMTFRNGSGWGSSDEEARRIFAIYVERGGNFVDTANFYGVGGSETLTGELIRPQRDRIVLSTKYSLGMRPGDPNASGNHRKNMMQSVEASLKRLGTDYIDLLYLHIWDDRTPAEEILRGFDDLVRAGKVLYAGISDTPAWRIAHMQAIADLRGWTPLVALQIPYSLAERTVEPELMGMARSMGLGVAPWSPLAGGVLTGKYGRADLQTRPPATSELSSRKEINLSGGRLDERTLAIAETVQAVAQEIGRSPSQVALAWTLLHPSVVSPIIGARTPAQLEDNLGALEVELTAGQIERLDSVSKAAPVFPYSFLSSPAQDFMFGNVKVARRHG